LQNENNAACPDSKDLHAAGKSQREIVTLPEVSLSKVNRIIKGSDGFGVS
jgi:hypothetical protein